MQVFLYSHTKAGLMRYDLHYNSGHIWPLCRGRPEKLHSVVTLHNDTIVHYCRIETYAGRIISSPSSTVEWQILGKVSISLNSVERKLWFSYSCKTNSTFTVAFLSENIFLIMYRVEHSGRRLVYWSVITLAASNLQCHLVKYHFIAVLDLRLKLLCRFFCWLFLQSMSANTQGQTVIFFTVSIFLSVLHHFSWFYLSTGVNH